MKGILRAITRTAAVVAFAAGTFALSACGPDFAFGQATGGGLILAKLNFTDAELTGVGTKVRKCVNTMPFQRFDAASIRRTAGSGMPNLDIWILADDEDAETTTRAIHLAFLSGASGTHVISTDGVPYEALKVNGTKRQTCVDVKNNVGTSNLEVILRMTGIATRLIGE